MAVAYTPPGVNVEELLSPSINPLLAASAQICILGVAQGYQVSTTQATFSADGTAQTLTAPEGTIFQKVDTNQTFESVRNLTNPAANTDGTYEEGTDFTTALSVDFKTITVTPVAATELATTGGTLVFKYRYVEEKYFHATRLDTQSAVEGRYGPAFNDTGIETPLSAATALAFENGAETLVVQPLFTSTSDPQGNVTRSQPTTGEIANTATWQGSVNALRDIEDINLIVPVWGRADNLSTTIQRDIMYAIQNHVNYMASLGQMLVAVFGHDDVDRSTLRDRASELRSRGTFAGVDTAEQAVLVSPARFTRALPSTGRAVEVGGQYVAAAIAGMVAARPVTAPLTRKQVGGFVTVEDPGDKSVKDADAGSGLLVVEQKGTSLQVRHGLTVDNTSTARRELSVVRAKHRMIESIRDTIENQVIGSVPADGNAPAVVKNAVITVLETLRQRRDLVEYHGVQARTLTNDPTTVECRFSYLPAFPLNYVHIVFSLDLSTGDVTTTIGAPAA